jgi:coproporphyrinogen III oxidase
VVDVLAFAGSLQERLCDSLEALDGEARFDRREVAGTSTPPGAARTRPWVMSHGPAIERAAIHVTHTRAARLPDAAVARRPELAGCAYEAASISAIVHPRNPYAPAGHLNLRHFRAERGGAAATAWFGGGFDLTPCYGFVEDAVSWHRAARAACAPFGPDVYPRFKAQCDDYFFLRHRGEARGIGGLFFDDLRSVGARGSDDLERCFAFVRGVGEAFASAYLPILERRRDTPYGERQRQFQLYRRGRYVEFNLLWDRGTRFGLEAGHPVESLLASLPPLAAWRFDWRAEPGSEEAALAELLQPRDWAELAVDETSAALDEAPAAARSARPRGES